MLKGIANLRFPQKLEMGTLKSVTCNEMIQKVHRARLIAGTGQRTDRKARIDWKREGRKGRNCQEYSGNNSPLHTSMKQSVRCLLFLGMHSKTLGQWGEKTKTLVVRQGYETNVVFLRMSRRFVFNHTYHCCLGILEIWNWVKRCWKYWPGRAASVEKQMHQSTIG